MAAKNTMTLGLVTPTVNPSSTILATVFRSTSAPSASASERRCLTACAPRKIRYAAPASLSTVNTATDRSTSAPIPNATATTCANAPTVLPATVATPAARPSAIARLTTNSTLGPGIAMSTDAVRVNASRCAVGTMPSAYEMAPEEGHRVSCAPTPCLQLMTEACASCALPAPLGDCSSTGMIWGCGPQPQSSWGSGAQPQNRMLAPGGRAHGTGT